MNVDKLQNTVCERGKGLSERLISAQSFLAGRVQAVRRTVAEAIDPSLAREARLAYVDPYTELPNGRAMKEQFALMVELGKPFGVIMLDIDDFKTINTTIGHVFADEVLVNFAVALESSLRADDELFYSGNAYRTGGDEFMILASFDARKDVPFTDEE